MFLKNDIRNKNIKYPSAIILISWMFRTIWRSKTIFRFMPPSFDSNIEYLNFLFRKLFYKKLRTIYSNNKRSEQFLKQNTFCKVQIFWEGHKKLAHLPPLIWHCLVASNYKWKMGQILWPSQNIWTLTCCWKFLQF